MPFFIPGHISFLLFEDDRKKMHVHPRSLVYVSSNFHIFKLTAGGFNAILWFYLLSVEVE
jgi:hypothetical protein